MVITFIGLNKTSFILMSLSGSFFAILGVLVSSLAYQGKQGQRYSPLNHFISELGEVGVSRLAWVFNLGLILSGLCLVPACIILGLLIPGFMSKIGMLTGVISAVGLSLVGVSPMNNLKPHALAAMTFFRGGLLMVLTFSLAIAAQSEAFLVLPRGFSLAGVPAILAFGSFLFRLHHVSSSSKDFHQPNGESRPRVWTLPILEWLIFLTIIAWFVMIAVGVVSSIALR